MDVWWRALVEALVAPSWMSNLLASVVGTFVGLAGTYAIFRRQLRHDRLLALESLNAAENGRRADSRAQQTTSLGETLAAAVNAPIGSLLPTATTSLLENDRLAQSFPASQALAEAVAQARLMEQFDLARAIDLLTRQRRLMWEEALSLSPISARWSEPTVCLRVLEQCRRDWIDEDAKMRATPEYAPPETARSFRKNVRANYAAARRYLRADDTRWGNTIKVFAVGRLFDQNSANFLQLASALTRWSGQGAPPGMNLVPAELLPSSSEFRLRQEYASVCEQLNRGSLDFYLRTGAWTDSETVPAESAIPAD